MKIIQSAAVFVLGFCLFTSCSKSKDATVDPSTPATAIDTALSLDGKWVISSYTQKTEDKTRQFSGYSFTFTTTATNSGSVSTVKDNSSFTGSWTHQPAVTYYGSSSKESVTLNLGTASELLAINKTWNVVSIDKSQISLVSPEVAEDTHLIFTKQ